MNAYASRACEDCAVKDFKKLHLVGRSATFLNALDLIQKIAACDATAFIQGETGTGKELAARAIHYLGERRSFPFVPVNCGALPDSLVENELFGHVRGAFTDARDAQSGLVATAEGGSLFLDEIETLSPKGQVALLRFLQDGVYRPLGGRTALAANVRVIAASNVDLSEQTRTGAFREDLFYRLAVLSVRMPALRERPGDAHVLAEHFIELYSRRYGKPAKPLDIDTAEALERHAWPGNVRELENLVHRAFLLNDAPTVRISELLEGPQGRREEHQEPGPHELSFACAKAHAIATFERSFLSHLLARAEGNVTLAARLCGKERRSLGRLLKKHGIDRNAYARSR
jgi:two-component system, NtrC family, response regulator GlrR